MTQEDKELLLKDLCARLPYDVKVCYENNTYYLNEINPACKEIIISVLIQDENRQLCAESVLIEEIKPYLRPMSSMTEEEEMYLNGRILVQPVLYGDDAYYDDEEILSYVDFCYYRHLDIRGLIPKGLALEAPEDMYNLNKE